ncbi:unnamed protein product [Moneuplotes crassus]|uniref:Cyclin N-terminal domain-containing protein n=1 Tax=Euplotes crassus TaxID=5936 RepID=A0AAD2DAJ3_EUPCR|nr:unnamed protein product [Moneuplotes crassus]
MNKLPSHKITKAQWPRESISPHSKSQICNKNLKAPARHFVTQMNVYSDEKNDEKLYKKVLLEDEKYQNVDLSADFQTNEPKSTSRRQVLKWIYHFGQKFKQSCITIQTAIIYFDKLIGKLPIMHIKHESDLWAATCLLVASKFAEPDMNVVRISDLRKVNKKFKLMVMKKYEKKLCSILNWELNFITPAHYRDSVVDEAHELEYCSKDIYGHNDTIILMSTELRNIKYSTIECACYLYFKDLQDSHIAKTLINSFGSSVRDIKRCIEYLSGYKKPEEKPIHIPKAIKTNMNLTAEIKLPSVDSSHKKNKSVSNTGRSSTFEDSNCPNRSISREQECANKYIQKYNVTSKISKFKEKNSFCQQPLARCESVDVVNNDDMNKSASKLPGFMNRSLIICREKAVLRKRLDLSCEADGSKGSDTTAESRPIAKNYAYGVGRMYYCNSKISSKMKKVRKSQDQNLSQVSIVKSLKMTKDSQLNNSRDSALPPGFSKNNMGTGSKQRRHQRLLKKCRYPLGKKTSLVYSKADRVKVYKISQKELESVPVILTRSRLTNRR